MTPRDPTRTILLAFCAAALAVTLFAPEPKALPVDEFDHVAIYMALTGRDANARRCFDD